MTDPVFSGYGRTRDSVEMVSALTHVVSGSGQRTIEWVPGSGFPVTSGLMQASSPRLSPLWSSSGHVFGSGSSSWVGQKRGREEDSGGSSSQLIEAVLRVHRACHGNSQKFLSLIPTLTNDGKFCCF